MFQAQELGACQHRNQGHTEKESRLCALRADEGRLAWASKLVLRRVGSTSRHSDTEAWNFRKLEKGYMKLH